MSLLTTDRLLLRPLTPADAAAVQRMADDPAIAGTTARIPHPYELHHARQWIDSITSPGARARTWGVTLRSDGTLIGSVSLTFGDEGRPTRATLGYWIGSAHWNQGYATEAARAVVRHGFEEMGLETITAVHLTRNPASGRVLGKLGMRHTGSSFDVVRGELEPVELYVLDRAMPER